VRLLPWWGWLQLVYLGSKQPYHNLDEDSWSVLGQCPKFPVAIPEIGEFLPAVANSKSSPKTEHENSLPVERNLTSGERFWLGMGFIALDTSLPHLPCITLDFMADNAHEHIAALSHLCWWLLVCNCDPSDLERLSSWRPQPTRINDYGSFFGSEHLSVG